jgi:hypothetical protein
VDGGHYFDFGWKVLAAGLFAGRDLHHAAVFAAAL